MAQKRWRAATAACLLGLALSAAARAQSDSLQGRWRMELLAGGETLSVMLERTPAGGGSDRRFFKLRLAELSDITRAQIVSDGAQVSFRLRRRAGTFNFSGSFAAGKGAGAFSFAIDPAFAAAMEREGYGEALRQNLFGFAIGDYGGQMVEDLAALGVERPTPEQLQRMQQFGVNVEFVKELRALGYEPRSVEQLISLKQQGAGVAFIKALMARGYERPPFDLLIGLRTQGVTPQFIDELKALGYEHVPLNQLVAMRTQGITTDFIRQLRAQGFTNVPLNQLFNVRMFKMPVEFLNHLPTAGEREQADGEWLLRFNGRAADEAWLLLSGAQDGGGHSVEISAPQLRGLSAAEAFSGGAAVRFTIALRGRTLSCTGWFKDGYGTGVFTSITAPATR